MRGSGGRAGSWVAPAGCKEAPRAAWSGPPSSMWGEVGAIWDRGEESGGCQLVVSMQSLPQQSQPVGATVTPRSVVLGHLHGSLVRVLRSPQRPLALQQIRGCRQPAGPTGFPASWEDRCTPEACPGLLGLQAAPSRLPLHPGNAGSPLEAGPSLPQPGSPPSTSPGLPCPTCPL